MKNLLKRIIPPSGRQKRLEELQDKIGKVKERERKLLEKLSQTRVEFRPECPKYLVAKTSTVGLGNRILFLVGCIVQSRYARRRLVVDWRDGTYGAWGENSFWHFFEESEAFHIREFKFLEEAPPADFSLPEWAGNMHRSIKDYHNYLRENAWEAEFAEDVKLPGKRWKGHGFFNRELPQRIQVAFGAKSLLGLMKLEELQKLYPGLDRDEVISHILRTEFRPCAELRTRLDQFVKANFGTGRVLGVHVRNTDAVPEISVIELRARAVEIAAEIKAQSGEEPRVFLATDHEPTQDVFREVFQDRLILQPKLRDNSCKTMHLSKTFSGEQKREVGLQALLDIYALAACTDLFLQYNSSFSRIAAYLAALPPEQVEFHSTGLVLDWES